MKRLLVLILLLTACGGDPVTGAGNCTELLQATVRAAAELPDGDFPGMSQDERIDALDDYYAQWDALAERVAARAEELIGPALERGADMEAVVCAEAVDEAQAPVAKVFTEPATAP